MLVTETGMEELEIANGYLSSKIRNKLWPTRLLYFVNFWLPSKFQQQKEQQQKTWIVTEEDT